ncbi:rRNA-processing protein UTP23 homolog [Lineus longissimus]|uniref:rRNA-processing protein UTP23 homolog n=1 Tax=Lineus longissimus TaxID=88925 RepID=UPI002B4F9B1C
MKIKRNHHVHRVLTFYKNSFGFNPPYNVLIDGTFCKAALSHQVNISEQTPKYLGAEVKFYTTACVKAECKAFGTLLFGPWKILQQFEEKPCGHANPVPASKCLYKLLKRKKNQGKYMLATQDPELSEVIRIRPGIPLLYISHKAINLEKQSNTSQEVADRTLHQKLEPVTQHKTIEKLKVKELGESADDSKPKKRKRKGPPGPNPLSCQKKKRKMTVSSPGPDAATAAAGKKKRKRHKRKKGALVSS